jgi:hypothetical protein
VESFLDVNDAIRRRTKANQIYKDLQAERISRQRAAQELRALDKRQKGGWLRSASVDRRPPPTKPTTPNEPVQQPAAVPASDIQHAPTNAQQTPTGTS